ncbi:hypothetical protein F750_6398 [Streptomyces sp. PAMC 26508]|uniref:hypothetical protein n=1 Tax=Streptomyces sp. PAMC 26508 TaxID=1265601 RepID=UPI0002C6E360|nr:hypothetical protein [Streptomyces sp. PAMC 26508]AGJ58823.1 hypothetical protein F750_6398 [Streptomyces sp. PAMC 26508]
MITEAGFLRPDRGRLLHVFTEPQTLLHAEAHCPACGDQDAALRRRYEGAVCVYYKVRNVPGYPPQGCPGEVADTVRGEPNPKYEGPCLPGIL